MTESIAMEAAAKDELVTKVAELEGEVAAKDELVAKVAELEGEMEVEKSAAREVLRDMEVDKKVRSEKI